jgi:membrane fusion protein (multidrug efflux system)
VQKRLFQEGSDVKAGQALFQIDNTRTRPICRALRRPLHRPKPPCSGICHRTPLQAAGGSQCHQQAGVRHRHCQRKAALAQVAAGKAAVTNANVNLGYASVTAPISGRIGRALVTEGALVGQGEATQLATIQQVNPLYVNLTQSSRHHAHARSAQFRQVSKGR